MNDQFAEDVLKSLSAKPKFLSSKYFYDEKGDALFQQIMKLEEYYLTRAEYSILNTYKDEMLKVFRDEVSAFNLVEFGAGDGYKTKVLLAHFVAEKTDFKYAPIDISGNVLNILETSLKKEWPELKVQGIQNEYFKALKELENRGIRNVVLFMGSNIGNFTKERAKVFLSELHAALKPGDILLLGCDLKKDPAIIHQAYNDRKGVTAAFNLNLLQRINDQLNGNFNLEQFRHYPIYDPLTGTATSYLVSTVAQDVSILGTTFHFDAWEPIHMEVSQKYDINELTALANASGFTVTDNFYDLKKHFVNAVWKR